MEETDGVKYLVSDIAQCLLFSSAKTRSAQQDLLPPSYSPNMTGTFFSPLFQTIDQSQLCEAEYDIIIFNT